jgi:hypothetical protein
MAIDRWFPTKFAMLSDRLVTQKGILLMGGAALVTMMLTSGSVKYLVVLYSINVFITFFLSQLGMVRHWWQVRGKEDGWEKKLFINAWADTDLFYPSDHTKFLRAAGSRCPHRTWSASRCSRNTITRIPSSS